MTDLSDNWLTVEQAAKYFGYSHPESLRHRLRQLRKRGEVVDTGRPPREYRTTKGKANDKILLYWPNPRTALISRDAPRRLLQAKRGKRRKLE